MRIHNGFVIVLFALLSLNTPLAKAAPCDFSVCKSDAPQKISTDCCKKQPANPVPQDSTKIIELSLHVSPNGKAILDQNGQEVARFVAGTQLQSITSLDEGQKLPGCMRCWETCHIYDGEVCVKYVRTCQWDFDCKSP